MKLLSVIAATQLYGSQSIYINSSPNKYHFKDMNHQGFFDFLDSLDANSYSDNGIRRE